MLLIYLVKVWVQSCCSNNECPVGGDIKDRLVQWCLNPCQTLMILRPDPSYKAAVPVSPPVPLRWEGLAEVPAPPRWKRNTAFFSGYFLQLVLLLSFCASCRGARGRREAQLGRSFLWGGWGLWCRAGGGRGGTLQGPQSLAEPRVLGSLDFSHQDSPLMLQLLQKAASL